MAQLLPREVARFERPLERAVRCRDLDPSAGEAFLHRSPTGTARESSFHRLWANFRRIAAAMDRLSVTGPGVLLSLRGRIETPAPEFGDLRPGVAGGP